MSASSAHFRLRTGLLRRGLSAAAGLEPDGQCELHRHAAGQRLDLERGVARRKVRIREGAVEDVHAGVVEVRRVEACAGRRRIEVLEGGGGVFGWRAVLKGSSGISRTAKSTLEDLFDSLGDCNGDEVVAGIEIVLAGFIDDPDQAVLLCPRVGETLVDLEKLASDAGYSALLMQTT